MLFTTLISSILFLLFISIEAEKWPDNFTLHLDNQVDVDSIQEKEFCSGEIERCSGDFGAKNCNDGNNTKDGKICCCEEAPICKRRPPGGLYTPRRCHRKNYTCGRQDYACLYSYGHANCKNFKSNECCCEESPICKTSTPNRQYCTKI